MRYLDSLAMDEFDASAHWTPIPAVTDLDLDEANAHDDDSVVAREVPDFIVRKAQNRARDGKPSQRERKIANVMQARGISRKQAEKVVDARRAASRKRAAAAASK